MARWLFKEEPTHYGFDDLVRDGKTRWSGVRSAVAQKHLRAVAKGDEVFFYHTGGEKAVVGLARALTAAYPDPDDPSGKSAVVDIGPVRKLATPVALATLKADPRFATMPLVRVPRLSVMPVTNPEWTAILALGGERQ